VLDSDPGDWVGQGQDWDILYTPDNSAYFNVAVYQNVSGEPAHIRFDLGSSPNTLFGAEFATVQLGHSLVPGLYLDAQRASSAEPGHPGMDVTFQHRGANALSGWFEVHSFLYHADATAQNGFRVDYFRVNFEQHSENQQPALHGFLEYSAVPEPASLLVLAPALLLARRRRKG
jgi:hypothetical protein